jgi:hypothetical protein
MDRREFLGFSGGAVAVVLTPLASLVPAVPVAAAVRGPELVSDWSVDDMWGVDPRPHAPIGYGRVRNRERGAASVDAAFVTPD